MIASDTSQTQQSVSLCLCIFWYGEEYLYLPLLSVHQTIISSNCIWWAVKRKRTNLKKDESRGVLRPLMECHRQDQQGEFGRQTDVN